MALGFRGEAGWRAPAYGEVESACRLAVAVVSAGFGIAVADMHGARRGPAPVAFARQTAMYLAHVKLGIGLCRVGGYFRRDRTTVAHACALVEDRRDEPRVEQVVACLEAAIDYGRMGASRPEAGR